MQSILVIHGTKGSPDINWFPWLRDSKLLSGYKINIPQMPTPINQSALSWMDVIETGGIKINEQTILIGHSCGATFLLHLLEKYKIHKAIFVSPVLNDINIPEYDELNKSFYNYNFDWKKIQNNTNDITILHGNNDPYVPLSHAEFLHEKIGGQFINIENGGHLNGESGYTEFPLLIDFILSNNSASSAPLRLENF